VTDAEVASRLILFLAGVPVERMIQALSALIAALVTAAAFWMRR